MCMTKDLAFNGGLESLSNSLVDSAPVFTAENNRNMSDDVYTFTYFFTLSQFFSKPLELITGIGRVAQKEVVLFHTSKCVQTYDFQVRKIRDSCCIEPMFSNTIVS